jgi:hypothetical protein
MKKKKRANSIKSAHPKFHMVNEQITIPQSVIDDRNRRALLPPNPFGDPPPGYSALEKKCAPAN